ncbi:unnamed protein product [Sympodiomycopsis kandeliae]
MPSEETTLSQYILERLAQLGTKVVQGVPGDYNLPFLDYIEDHPALEWCGNANELNAAYSADGYARTKRKIAALVTTFGVGELSALNGVAGAFAERVPVAHIVGVPSTSAQGKHALLHHTLGDGRFDAFEQMSRHISGANLRLGDLSPQEMPREIDRVLSTCVREARPVYISLPMDLVDLKIPAGQLSTPLNVATSPNDPDTESHVLKEIVNKVRSAKDPIILIDACTIRHDVIGEAHDLVNQSGLPIFSSPMGKTAITEEHPQYGGLFLGDVTAPQIRERVLKADCIISVGALLSDFNTGNFSYRTPREATIELHSDHTSVGYAQYPGISMKTLLPKITSGLAQDKDLRLAVTQKTITRPKNVLPTPEQEGDAAKSNPDIISQAWLWPRVGQFFRKGDQVIVETGTSSFGMLDATLPDGTRFHSQVLWGSIGWSVGATLGVSLAAREDSLGRVCLFVGDGSLQLTLQEIGTMIRQGLCPIIFVLSNSGYEIERNLHGPERSYNDIQPYNHSLLLDTLSLPSGGNGKDNSAATSGDPVPTSHAKDKTPSKKKYHSVRTKQELDTLLKDEEFNKADCIQLVEVFMLRGDAPRALKGQAKASAEAQKQQSK